MDNLKTNETLSTEVEKQPLMVQTDGTPTILKILEQGSGFESWAKPEVGALGVQSAKDHYNGWIFKNIYLDETDKSFVLDKTTIHWGPDGGAVHHEIKMTREEMIKEMEDRDPDHIETTDNGYKIAQWYLKI